MAIAERDQPPPEASARSRAGNLASPSVAAEMFWGVRNATKPGAGLPADMDAAVVRSRRLPARLRDLWGDGVTCYTEIFVLAARAGCLDGDDPEALLRSLSAAARMPLEQHLLTTEDPQEFKLIVGRLAALHSDAKLRSAYTRLLETLWESQEAAWRDRGRATVRHTARAWQAELQRGASPALVAQATPERGCRPDLVAMADEAAAQGRLLISPTFFGSGFCVVDAGPLTILSSPGEHRDEVAAVRTAARAAAARYKALSDPTRMAVLALLRKHPSTIGEIARRLEISQPTVSAHFAALRGAGLVREAGAGRPIRYALDQARLDAILAEVRGVVLQEVA